MEKLQFNDQTARIITEHPIIAKVAFVTDSILGLARLSHITDHFTYSEVPQFPDNDCDTAEFRLLD